VRIGLIRSAEPIQALAAAKVVERVDRKPHPERRARRLDAGHDAGRVGPRARVARGRERHQPEPARRRARVDHAYALAAPVRARERLGGLARGLARARETRGDVDRHDVQAVREQRLVDRREVADRRLRGRRPAIGRLQLLEEGVAGEVRLAGASVTLEVDVERDDSDPELLRQRGGQVAGAVGDDGDGRHPAATLHL
jgi:hypothetical protein